MQTLKTAVVVVLLLAVCYGAFKALNAPDPELPASIQAWLEDEDGENLDFSEIDIDTGDPTSLEGMETLSPEELMSSFSTGSSGSNSSEEAQSSSTLSLPSIPSLSENPQIGSESEGLPALGDFSSAQPAESLPPLPSDTADTKMASLPNPKPGNGPTGTTQDATPQGLPAFPNPGVSPGQDAIPAIGSLTEQLGSLPEMKAEAKSLKEQMDQMLQQGAQNASESVQGMEDALKQRMESAKSELQSGMQNVSREIDAEVNAKIGEMGAAIENKTQALMVGLAKELPGGPTTPAPTTKFVVAREQALAMASRGELQEALAMLSAYYDSPELTSTQNSDLMEILDALAREVIYSKRHSLEPPYQVRPSDSVASVAKQFGMNAELLSALNGLGESNALVQGTELKVIRGPFHAIVDLSDKELTLFVNKLYAGRFPFTAGSELNARPGDYSVIQREQDRTYYPPLGSKVGTNILDGKDPRNPYGGFWINLDNELSLCIHGSPQMPSPDLKGAGCISLAPRDAQHVFSILSRASKVRIQD